MISVEMATVGCIQAGQLGTRVQYGNDFNARKRASRNVQVRQLGKRPRVLHGGKRKPSLGLSVRRDCTLESRMQPFSLDRDTPVIFGASASLKLLSVEQAWPSASRYSRVK